MLTVIFIMMTRSEPSELQCVMGSLCPKQKYGMIRKMRKGEVIKCPHNIEHWHRASPTTSVTHIAISSNTQLGEAKWIRPVTDEEYGKKPVN